MQYIAHICHIMQFSQIILVFFCIVGMVLKCEWRIALAFWTANCFSLLLKEGKQSSYIYTEYTSLSGAKATNLL